jgi:hypothetical protein
MMKTAVITLMLMTLVQFNAVEALKCYQCGSASNDFLCDGTSRGTAVTCPTRANACYKGYATDGQDFIVERSCVEIASSVSLSCTNYNLDEGIRATVCFCNTDLCNSAVTLHGIGQHQMTLYALSVTVSLLLAFFTR